MTMFITGLFDNSKHAGMAVSELKSKDLAENLSVIAKDESGDESKTQTVVGDPLHGAKGGAIAGAAVGGLGALAIGTSAITLPGLGLLVAGPIATALASMAGGAITGGLVGSLVDHGVSKDLAKDYEDNIKRGQVLTALTVNDASEVDEINSILKAHGAHRVEVFEK